MAQRSRNDDFRVSRSRSLLGLLAGSLVWGAFAGPAPAGGIVVEPLMLRVQDAVGAPGEQTAIVFRTYASRPVRRGRLAAGVGSGLQGLDAFTRIAGTSTPIASCDAVQIFSVQGDAISQPCGFDVPTQSFDLDFEALSATINARDGVFGVMFVTLAPDVVPGAEYEIALDLGLSFLNDPEDDPVLIETRSGTLKIRAPTAPVGFSVDGGKAQPGSGAVIEIGTEEPYDLQEGRLVLTYDPAIAWGPPVVVADPRHGDVTLTVTYPQAGKVQIDFDSALETFNRVPGDLLTMHFGTRPTAVLGTTSPLAILTGPNESALIAPGSMPLQVTWEADGIEFELDPGIFNDGFDGGDSGFWSYLP